MRTVRYYTQGDKPGVMLPGRHYRVDDHGSIRSLANRLSKKERSRRKRLAKAARAQ
jgi:hypothetical protein